MPQEYFDDEFKKVDLVWLLNLCPPGAGIGTLYACGPGAAFLLLFIWAYLIIQHASWEPVLQAYLITSIVGTLGCVYRNMKLKKYLEKQESNDPKARPEKSIGTGVLTQETAESEVEKIESVEPDTILLESEPDQIEIKAAAINIEEVLKEHEEENQIAGPEDRKEIVSESQPEFELKAQEEEHAGDKIEVQVEEKEIEELEEKDIESDKELVIERNRLMDKLSEATGEFQPQLKEPQEYESFTYSQPSFEDAFKFEIPEFNFEKALTASANEKSGDCCQCGAEVNKNFSFCLACGKNF